MSDLRIDPVIMDVLEIVKLMSDGNPGAFSACLALLEHAHEVDPDTTGAAEKCLLRLDTMHLYGTELCLLWNDVCKRDLASLIAICRADEYGILGITPAEMRQALYNHDAGIDLGEVIATVQAFLPNFNR